MLEDVVDDGRLLSTSFDLVSEERHQPMEDFKFQRYLIDSKFYNTYGIRDAKQLSTESTDDKHSAEQLVFRPLDNNQNKIRQYFQTRKGLVEERTLFNGIYLQTGVAYYETRQVSKKILKEKSTDQHKQKFMVKTSGYSSGQKAKRKNMRIKRESSKSSSKISFATVELFLVVDYALYNIWNSLENQLKHFGSEETDMIHKYYSYVFRGIDDRLLTLSKEGIYIDAAFAGIYIAKTEDESFWTTTSTVEGDGTSIREMVNASEALEKFQFWLDNNTNLPHYDHAILFTGTNLTYAGSPGNTGLAFGSSMCLNISNSSIVEDQLDFRTITFASQQVARSLGANDDMDNNDCLEFFNYIMAPKLKLPVRSFASNRWKFSTCSQQYIRDYFITLNDTGLNCLYDTTLDVKYPNNITFVKEFLYGAVTSAKKQCQIKFGVASDICRVRIGTSYSKICSGLLCKLPNEDTCDYILPADGTPCGDRKYCWRGTCQTFDDAMKTSDSCVFGNDPTVECDAILQTNVSLCYKETIRYTCCHSCESVALDVPGCEYGDRLDDCNLQNCVKGNNNYVQTLCCLTCSNGPTPYSQQMNNASQSAQPLQPTTSYSITSSFNITMLDNTTDTNETRSELSEYFSSGRPSTSSGSSSRPTSSYTSKSQNDNKSIKFTPDYSTKTDTSLKTHDLESTDTTANIVTTLMHNETWNITNQTTTTGGSTQTMCTFPITRPGSTDVQRCECTTHDPTTVNVKKAETTTSSFEHRCKSQSKYFV